MGLWNLPFFYHCITGALLYESPVFYEVNLYYPHGNFTVKISYREDENPHRLKELLLSKNYPGGIQ